MFREKNGYMDNSGSWFTNKGIARRYDHIFGSKNISILESYYDQEPREQKYSDHSPLIAELVLWKLYLGTAILNLKKNLS